LVAPGLGASEMFAAALEVTETIGYWTPVEHGRDR